MTDRIHSPITGRGKERQTSHGKQPGGIAPSWPARGRQAANSLGLRRKPKQQHPDCATDRKPVATLIKEWLRAGLTKAQAADVVRTTLADDSLAQLALASYRKMATVEEGDSNGFMFPITAGDLAGSRASSILENIE